MDEIGIYKINPSFCKPAILSH
uniref:Uncharacterized protein n=1 Tax=mine drainage metagenome TaxID=410659 RepID=E6QHA2_9ZZZZ